MNKKSSSKLFFRAFFTILTVLTLVVIGAFCAYMLWEKAPEISDEAPAQVSAQPVNSDSESDDTGTAFSTDRQDGVYTVLLVGNDDGNGNTDTIIVGKIDTVQHKMDFVSIPRDTLVNISWNIRKINAVYWGTVNSGGVGIDGLRLRPKVGGARFIVRRRNGAVREKGEHAEAYRDERQTEQNIVNYL